MYKDYYLTLELSYSATHAEIKKNYRALVKKWHPDVNKSQDTTSKMQDITEAYLILSDSEARQRYDQLHKLYFRQNIEENGFSKTNERNKNSENAKEDDWSKKERQSTSTVNHDPILDDWILKAKHQAKEFVHQSIKDAQGIALNGCKYTVFAIGFSLILFIVILLIIKTIG